MGGPLVYSISIVRRNVEQKCNVGTFHAPQLRVAANCAKALNNLLGYSTRPYLKLMRPKNINKVGSKVFWRSPVKALLATVLAVSTLNTQAAPRRVYSAVIALGNASTSFSQEKWDWAMEDCEDGVADWLLDGTHDLVYTYNGAPYVVLLGQQRSWYSNKSVCRSILIRDTYYPVEPGTLQSPRVLVSGTFNGKSLTFRGSRGDVLALRSTPDPPF